jgi:dolichyl-phosphate beta-glucosyltransferase
VYLSIIIPCFNEEKRLPETLTSVESYLKSYPHEYEVIVVDDGSTDNTKAAGEAFSKRIANLRVLRFETNGGKGHAVKYGMLAAKGDYAIFMDADNSTPLGEIEKLMPFAQDYEVVIGSRHLKTSNVVIKQPWYRIIISRLGNLLIQSLLIRGVRDTQCGFKLFKKPSLQAIYERQRIMGFGFDMEILAIAQKVLGLRIKEVPVSWYNSPESRIRPVRDAWRTLKELIRIKYNLLTGQYK